MIEERDSGVNQCQEPRGAREHLTRDKKEVMALFSRATELFALWKQAAARRTKLKTGSSARNQKLIHSCPHHNALDNYAVNHQRTINHIPLMAIDICFSSKDRPIRAFSEGMPDSNPDNFYLCVPSWGKQMEVLSLKIIVWKEHKLLSFPHERTSSRQIEHVM